MKAYKPSKIREAIPGLAFLAPDILGLLVIYILPILFTAFLSFHSWTGMDKISYVGPNNYVSLFRDSIWVKSVIVTIKYTLMYVPIIVIGSLILALLVNSEPERDQNLQSPIFPPNSDADNNSRGSLGIYL